MRLLGKMQEGFKGKGGTMFIKEAKLFKELSQEFKYHFPSPL